MKYIERYLPLAIVFLGIFVYINSLACPMIFDDNYVIIENHEIRHIFPAKLTSRIVCDLTFKLNYAFSNLNVADYHATNITIHILGALFLFGIIARSAMMLKTSSSYANWLAFICSSIWVVHPLNTQSVTYICQRYESLMGMFALASIYTFARSVTSKQRLHQRIWFDTCLASCALALATKESSFGLPIIILLFDYIFVAKSDLRDLNTRKLQHIALFCTWGIILFLQINFIGTLLESSTYRVASISPFIYLCTQFKVIVRYIQLSFAPFSLCFNYGWQPVGDLQELLPQATVIIIMGIASIYALARRRVAGFLGVCFFVLLAPTSSFMPIDDIIEEHRMYLPLVTIIILTSITINKFLDIILKSRNKHAGVIIKIILTTVVICTFATITIERNRNYRSESAIWRDALTKHPDDLRNKVCLASALTKEHKFTKARALFSEVFAAMSPDPKKQSLVEKTLFVEANVNVGYMDIVEKNYTDAVTHLRRALSASKNDVNTLNNLGSALSHLDKTDEAIAMWEHAVRLSPNDAFAHIHLAATFQLKAKYKKAIQHFERAIQSRPDIINSKVSLAWLLATCPDPTFRDPDRALKLTQDATAFIGASSIRSLDITAAAYAAKGDFHQAVIKATEAITLGKNRNISGLEEIEKRRTLYLNKHPYLLGTEHPAHTLPIKK